MAKATAIFNMATKIDIANQALSLLGDPATVTSIDPPDGSDQAGNISRWYPIALRRLEEEYGWSFLTKAVRPALIGDDFESLYGYKYAYRVPADNVRIIGVYEDGGKHEQCAYKVQVYDANDSLMIVTNEESPVVRYVAHIDKSTLYPQYFVECLVILLATYLIGPIRESNFNNQSLAGLMKAYDAALIRAKNADNQMSRHDKAIYRLPSHLKARMV